MDMPYTGTLTTILSGIEPAIAIVLAYVPLMQPILRKFSSKADSSRSGYNTGGLSGSYTKHKEGSREQPGIITELFEDDDDGGDSQIQLQPVHVSKAAISTISHDTDGPAIPHYSRAITVQKT
jgi:hypothetical protein